MRAGLVLAVAMFFANVSNFLFQVVAGRFLTPDEYGLLSSIFTMIVIVGVATSSLQAAFAKAEVARRDLVVLRERRGVGLAFADPLVRTVLVASIGFGLVLVMASPFLGHFFHSAAAPIALFAVLVPAIAMLSLSVGRLQGMERFFGLAVLSIGSALAKLALCGGVLIVGLGVTSVVGMLTLVTVGAATAGLVLTSDSPPLADRAIFSDVARALVALMLFRLLVGVDVPLARHWLEPDVAGQYAAASVIGKGVLWLPDIVALVVFPQLAAAKNSGQDANRLLRRAASLSLAVCLLGTLGLWLFGDIMFDQIFGGEYVGAGSLAWKLALVSTPLALANLFIFFHVAGRGWRWLVWVAVVLAFQIAAFTAFHDTQGQFVVATAFGAIALTLGLGVPALRPRGVVPAASP
jgi:O-antigen/teichoic acid export membrane protein